MWIRDRNLKRAVAVGKQREQGSNLKEAPIPVAGASRNLNTGNNRAA